MTTETEIEVLYLQGKEANECWQVPEARGGKEVSPLTGLRGSVASLTPRFQTSGTVR